LWQVCLFNFEISARWICRIFQAWRDFLASGVAEMGREETAIAMMMPSVML
jgi:hypothetical protein